MPRHGEEGSRGKFIWTLEYSEMTGLSLFFFEMTREYCDFVTWRGGFCWFYFRVLLWYSRSFIFVPFLVFPLRFVKMSEKKILIRCQLEILG